MRSERCSSSTVLVTGGAGFIGSNFVLGALVRGSGTIVNLDKLTYAGNLSNLEAVHNDPRHVFVRGDIGDTALVEDLLARHRPSAIVNFAAESHVDRSIQSPADFVATNVVGTFCLLEAARQYWMSLPSERKDSFRFLHVSTDEVYGSLGPNDPAFTEVTPYAPNSPYAASKASSDHLVRAYFHTYGLPTLTTNCSNNYGPFQFPEKLIPLMTLNALEGKPLPVYGDGSNVRDWLFVGDHCEAIHVVLEQGIPGETYNIGGNSEKTNIDVVRRLCSILDEVRPDPAGPYHRFVTFVADRPGHDRRYAIDPSKMRCELAWVPRTSFEQGMRQTVTWYLNHMDWVANITSGMYRQWKDTNFWERQAT